MKPFDVYPVMDLNIKRSLGAYVWDDKGRKYLDFYGGHAVISIGHNHPHFIARLKKQMEHTVFYSNSVQNPLQYELAEKLGELSNKQDYQLFMVNSGAEAIENALKLASFKNGRTKILAFQKGFHGRTSAAVHITDNTKISANINKGFDRVLLPWNAIDETVALIARGDVCAVVVEGIQGIGGIHVPNAAFLQKVEQACRQYGSIFILDEIQSGYGRTGKFFAHQFASVQPHLITTAKGMGNGFPIGGILIAPEFEAQYGLLGSTFGGTHLACAAGLAVLEVIKQEDLMENAAKRGQQLKSALSKLPHVLDVRGEGCMIGIDLAFPAKPFRSKLIQDYGVFSGSSSQPNTIRVLPPLSVSKIEVETFISAFEACLQAHYNDINNEAILVSQ